MYLTVSLYPTLLARFEVNSSTQPLSHLKVLSPNFHSSSDRINTTNHSQVA